MSSMPKKDRQPGREFLSEFSLGQRMRHSTEKHYLKLKLSKLDTQCRRSLDEIDSEKKLIKASLLDQRQETYHRLRRERYGRINDGSTPEESPAPVKRPGTPDPVRSVSVDLLQGPRNRLAALNHMPKSADLLRKRKPDFMQFDREKGKSNPERILSLAERRHSDHGVAPLNYSIYTSGTRSAGKGFSFSKSLDADMTSADHDRTRKLTRPVLSRSLTAPTIPRVRMARSLDADKDTPRPLERRFTLDANHFRLPQRHTFKKAQNDLNTMASMHGVMQRTSIFQIQESESNEDSEEADVSGK